MEKQIATKRENPFTPSDVDGPGPSKKRKETEETILNTGKLFNLLHLNVCSMLLALSDVPSYL